MITYLSGVVIVFFTLLLAARILNKKLHLYDDTVSKRVTTFTIVLISVFWIFTMPVVLVLAFFLWVINWSAKLLK